MKTYMAVKSEIAKLEKQAEALRKSELKNVISQIRKAITEYGLTAADLGFGAGAGAGTKTGGRKAAGKRRAKATAGVAKYRDPATQQTWTGHGRPPAWIVAAKNRDDYLIDAAAGKPAKKRAAAKKARGAKARGKKLVKTPAVRIESGVATS
jgi:DNA-binding protein H-NS